MSLLLEAGLQLGQLAAAALGFAPGLFPGRDLVGQLVLAVAEAELGLLDLTRQALGGEIAGFELGANLLETTEHLGVSLTGRVQLGLGATPAGVRLGDQRVCRDRQLDLGGGLGGDDRFRSGLCLRLRDRLGLDDGRRLDDLGLRLGRDVRDRLGLRLGLGLDCDRHRLGFGLRVGLDRRQCRGGSRRRGENGTGRRCRRGDSGRLHRCLRAQLLHQCIRDVVAGDETAPDEDVRKAALRRNLLGKSALEIGLGDQAALDEELRANAMRSVPLPCLPLSSRCDP